MAKNKKWSRTEERVLRAMYPDTHNHRISEMLGRSIHSIAQKGFMMGLHKSDAFIEQEKRLAAERGMATRFKKGQKPQNAGKKIDRDSETYKKMSGTFFKKGRTPKNTKYDGHERVNKDGYIEVRVSQGRYVLKHRLVWEQHFGEVPKGMIIRFRNGNGQDTSIENLFLQCRADNMRENTIHRYPDGLKEAIRVLGKLKRKINTKFKTQEK